MNDEFTARFAFDPANRFCLGVEEEVWTVHPRTGLLISVAPRIFTEGYEKRLPGFKPELPAQQIEMITPVCRDLGELEAAVRRNQRTVAELGEQYGFSVSRSPVPVRPYSIDVFPTERYLGIRDRFGERLRGAYVAGLHVHVGLGDKEEAIAAMNACRLHLPVFLAISARSPTYAGRNTGYRSYRFVKYREMAGEIVPPYLEDWDDFVRVARDRGYVDDPRMCWWAIRISPHGTVELRICDLQASVPRTVGIAALFRLLVRLAVEKPSRQDRLSPDQILRFLEQAAKGGYDHKPYLASALRAASLPGFEEERRNIKRLLR